MNFRFLRRILPNPSLRIGLAVLLLVLAWPHAANAGMLSDITSFFGLDPKATLMDIGYGFVAKIFFFVGFIAASIAGIFVTLIAWLIEIVLNLNTKIMVSPIVTNGYGVTLSIANLIFVFGIIIMAIMTILRNQTYGMKNMLWKLVLMAILVNFGLPIVGTILGFSDSLSMYWLHNMLPQSAAITGNDQASLGGFASKLAGAFEPQKSFTNLINSSTIDKAGIGQEVGTGLGLLLAPITNLVITIITLVIIIFTLCTVFVLLLIRYVTLGLLLVALPVAWATWIFPAVSQYERWWNEFFKQAFFPPILLFFLWLGIQTAGKMSAINGLDVKAYQSDSTSPIWKTISEAFGSFISSAAGPLMQGLILCGIFMGGIIFARNINLRFSKEAISSAKAFGGYAGRRAGGTAARWATKEPTDRSGQGRVRRAINKPLDVLQRGVQKGVQSNLAKSYGVTKAVSAFGEKHDFGKTTNIRLAAKEKFKQARNTQDPLLRQQLESEGGALAALAAKRRAESHGILKTLQTGVGVFGKPDKPKDLSADEIQKIKESSAGNFKVVKEVTTEEPVEGGVLGPDGRPSMKQVTKKEPVVVSTPQMQNKRAQEGVGAAGKWAEKQKPGVKIEDLKAGGLNIIGGEGEKKEGGEKENKEGEKK